MQHRMIYRTADARWDLKDCPCREDHGPSVDEERLLVLQENADLRAELDRLRAIEQRAREVQSLMTSPMPTTSSTAQRGTDHG